MSRRKTYPDAPLQTLEELGYGTEEEQKAKAKAIMARLVAAVEEILQSRIKDLEEKESES